MYSLANKIYHSVIGSSEKQVIEESTEQEITKNTKTINQTTEETSQVGQTTVKVSLTVEEEENSGTTNITKEFTVPASVPKMQVSDFNGMHKRFLLVVNLVPNKLLS
jgi:hypothetical protein